MFNSTRTKIKSSFRDGYASGEHTYREMRRQMQWSPNTSFNEDQGRIDRSSNKYLEREEKLMIP